MSAASVSASSAAVPSPSRHSRCVVVSNLSPVLTLPILEDLFSTIGPVQSLHFHTPTPPSPPEPVCVVQFVHEKHADTALLITDTPIGDRNIHIQPYTQWASSHPPQLASSPGPAAAPAVPGSAASSPPTLPSPDAAAATDSSLISSPSVAASPAAPPASLPSPAPQSAGSFPFPLDPTFTSCTIYVGNLAPQVTDAVLHLYFSQVGPLVGTKLQADALTQNRFCFVEFTSMQAAHLALALHGQPLMGRPMKIGKASMGVGRPSSAQPALSSAASADKVASALAKVAAAQQAIASKLGVQVQTPAVSTILPALPTVGVDPAAAAAAALVAAVSADVENVSGEKGREATPAAGGEAREDRRERGGRSSRRHRSSSRSPSRSSSSRSPSRSRSRSGSRSPRRHRHRRSRHGKGSRERSHRRSKHRRSSSPSPSPRAGEKKDGGVAVVGADRWRADDMEDAASEKKDSGAPPPETLSAEKERGGEKEGRRSRERDRSRDRSRSRSRERSRERRSPHGRRGDHDGHRSSRRRKDWSDDENDRPFFHRGRGGPHFRKRPKAGIDPHQGMVWDGSAALALRTDQSHLLLRIRSLTVALTVPPLLSSA